MHGTCECVLDPPQLIGGAAASSASDRASAASSTPAHKGGVLFAVRQRRIALGGAAEVYTIDMNCADHLAPLEAAVTSFEPTMALYQRRWKALKFQITMDVVFHKAVDHAVVTDPLVTLVCEMAAVYAAESPKIL